MIGMTLGHYRIGEQLGLGVMGGVYQAKDPKLPHPCGGQYAQNSNPNS
jgi:hypothetical protein